MRHVGEQRPERDDELDAEIVREVGDEVGERPPAIVRLDAHEHDRIAVRPGNAGSEERVLRPFDPPGLSLVERHMRASRLEVDEELGIDVRELLRLPQACEVARRERGRLPAVVPPAEGADQDGSIELRPVVHPQLSGHRPELTDGQVAPVAARARTRPRA